MILASINQFPYPQIVEKTDDMHETDEGRLRWLMLRKNFIGGSEAAAAIGLSKWQTPYDLYQDKINPELLLREETEKMWAGRKLEPVIAEMFAERTGKHVVRQPYFYCHPVHTFMGANIDFGVFAENAGVECKNTSTKTIPDDYILQCHHYMLVTGADRWYLAYLKYGWQFSFMTIERDESLIEMLLAAEYDFWNNHVIPRVPPVPKLIAAAE